MKIKSIREYENAHVALWLVKDSCWVLGLHWLGMAMILPTILVAIDLAYRAKDDVQDFCHNIAVCCWIAANAVWMTGEFFFHDSLRGYASVFFALGVLVLITYYGWLRRRKVEA